MLLTGLIAAPAIVAVNNIMKISPLEKFSSLDNSDLWYYVNDAYWMKKSTFETLVEPKYSNFNTYIPVSKEISKTFNSDLHKIKPGLVVRKNELPAHFRKSTIFETDSDKYTSHFPRLHGVFERTNIDKEYDSSNQFYTIMKIAGRI